MIKLTVEDIALIKKKLEYRFKNSGSPILEKLNSDSDIEITDEDGAILKSKLEYRFKKSGNPVIEKLQGESAK